MSIYDSEYTCPNCGAILNDQYGFNPDNGNWTCTSCGQTLYGDDVYDGELFEGVMWYCDNCGALLNKQSGFYDGCGTWSCTECYHTNNISEDEIYDSQEDYQSQQGGETNAFDSFMDLFGRVADAINIDDEDDDSGDEDDEYEDEYDDDEYDEEKYEEDDDATYYYRESIEKDEEIQRLRNQNDRLKKENSRIKNEHRREVIKKYWKVFLISLGVIILVGFVAYQVSEFKKLIPVGMSSEEMKGLHYEDVANKLKATGFLNVRLETLDDLKIEDEKQEGLVEQVVIDDVHTFKETKKFSYEDEVLIRYHAIKEIYPPISSEDAEGKNYKDIVKKFEKAGFVNVKTKPIYDLVTGWLKSNGEVEEVIVDGDNDVSTYSSYRPDAEVIIKYHTFKKNKK